MNHMIDTVAIFGAQYLFLIILGTALIYFLKQDRMEQRRILLFALITLPATYIVSKLGALLYYDPRPFVVGHFVSLIPHEADNGFPSDHVLLCADLAALLYPSSRSMSIILWVLTLIVATSRVYAGVHHPADILGSIVMAVVTAAVVYRVIGHSNRQRVNR